LRRRTIINDKSFEKKNKSFIKPHEKLLGILRVSNPATRKDLAERTWLKGPGAVLVLIRNAGFVRDNGTK